MSDFQLDTSGAVEAPSQAFPGTLAWYRWPDLSPFVQGYVEALFNTGPVSDRERLSFVEHGYKFSDLSPEALAMILREDGQIRHALPTLPDKHDAGAHCWSERQAGLLRNLGLPPLTPVLSEDGKVNLVVQAQVGDA